jgi:KDO2-lipid IV(A) lauroyltransferase
VVLTAGLVHAAELAIPSIPAPLAPPIAEAIGTLAFAASPRARAAVRANLAVIAPGQRVSARRVFAEQVRNYLEIFKIPRIGAAAIRAMVEKRGWEHFTRAADARQGVIVASAHLGPISLVGQILTAHDYAVVLPVETERSEFQRAVNRARRAIGQQLVPTESPLAVVRALREGKVFGLLADRAVTGVGVRVPFFGREALLPSAHVALALRTGAPIIPAFSGREGERLVAWFEPPLELVATGDRDADVREGVRRWALVLERFVRQAPEQWTVFERVWADG